ncbi:MAG: LysM peptidoglycan-binding domain-containing protein, partial [Sphingomonadales bacterium]|nr:LysM peptidoglycan-binding domain-containing protein [Sphingomonadales bacterium]
MVAIVTGNGLGLERSSANVLGARGQLGSAFFGRGNESVTVNAANGNLVVSNSDEVLIGRGPDSIINRTYNSEGNFTDDNGDNWASIGSRVVDLVGGLNAAGSYLDRLDWDGGRTRYTYDASVARYVSKQGTGAYDAIYYTGTYWTWKDGVSGLVENYSEAYGNRVVSRTDRDGNSVTYSYASAAGNLTRIQTADGNYTDLTWSGNNLTSLVTTYTDVPNGTVKTLTRTRYAYDGYNRLSSVTVDLSPDDSSVADGRVYTTSYQYVGASKLIQTITQTDGSQLQIAYDGANRVSSITQVVENGVSRTTSFAYGAGYTNITDPQGNLTQMYFDGAGNLTTLREPETVAGGNPRVTSFSYDGNGNMTAAFVYDGWANASAGNAMQRDWYRYDARGNLFDHYRQQDGGYLVTRSYYNDQNQVLTESTYTALDLDGHGGGEPAGALTTRYVYDSEQHLRFRITPEGRVSEYRYDAPGNLVSTIDYVVQNVDPSGLAESVNWVEGDFINWVNWVMSVGGMASTARTDTSYDQRGNVTMVTSYSQVDSAGNGVLAAGFSRTIYVYAQFGKLLTKQSVDGLPSVSHTNLPGDWATGGVNVSAAGNVQNGQVAQQYTTQTAGGWSALYNGFAVSDGDTITSSLTLKAVGTSTATVGLYGYSSGWGDSRYAIARIVSGPGTITQAGGGYWNISGLSTTAETRIEVVRTYVQGDTGGGTYVYTDAAAAGRGFIASTPVTVRSRDVTESYAYDGLGRTIRFTNAKGVGTWTTYADAQNRTTVTLASGLTQSSTYNKAGELTAFVEAKGGFASDNALPAQTSWASSNVATSAAGMIDGAPGVKYVVNPGSTWSATYTGLNAAAGETYTYSVSLQAVGDGTSQQLALYGNSSGWGAGSTSTARIISGPGTLTQLAGGLWQVSGLSTTQATRVELTRNYTQAETGGAYLFIDHAMGLRAGAALIASGPSLVSSRYDEAWSDATFNNAQFDINNWGYANLAKAPTTAIDGMPANLYTVQATGQWTAVASGIDAKAGDTYTTAVSLQGTANTSTASLGIYGNTTGWGYGLNGTSTGRIVSGPGVITQEDGGLWNVTGLVAGQTTRIEITRTFAQDESGGVYLYPDRPGGWIAGHAVIAGATAITRTPGDLTSYKYDSLGNLRIVTDPAGKRTFFFYDNQRNKIGEVAADGAVSEYRYNAKGQITASVQYATRLTAAQISSLFDGFANPTGVTFPSIRPAASTADRWAWNVYDFAGQLIETIDAAGATTEFVYDGAGRVKYTWRRLNLLSSAQLDGFKVTPPATRTVPADYAGYDRITQNYFDKDGKLAGNMDAEGYLSRYVYDSAGRQVETIRYWNLPNLANRLTDSFATLLASAGTNAKDIHNYTVFDQRGQVAALIDGEGNVTRYGYDARGNVVRVARGQSVAANTAYTLATLPAENGTLEITTTTRDALGQVLTQTRIAAGGNMTSSASYALNGSSAQTVDAFGDVTTRYFDARGRLVRVDVPIGSGSAVATTRYFYDSRGNQVKTIDARGNASYNYYDERSRLVLAIDAEGFATETTYDAFGGVSTVTRYYNRASGIGNVLVKPTVTADSRDATTTFLHEMLGRVSHTIDAQNKVEVNWYNAFGDKIQTQNKLGAVISYAYTRRGQLYYEYDNGETMSRSDGSTQAGGNYNKLFIYDAFGNAIQFVEAYGLSERRDTYFSYDRNNRLTQKVLPAIAVYNPATGVDTLTGRSEAYVYDARGNLIESRDALGARSLFYYDQANRKIAGIAPTGTHTTYVYDGNGNVTSQSTWSSLTALPATPGGTPPAPGGSARTVNYVYDRNDQLVEKRIDNVVAGELVGGNYVRNNYNLSTTYAYDAMGHVTQETDARGNSVFHYYDKNGRESAKVDQELYLTTWARDSEGNVTEERRYATQMAALPGVSGYTAPATSAADRVTQFTYDKMGRRLTEKRLGVAAATVSGVGPSLYTGDSTITYSYNALGEVLTKTEATGDTTTYEYDTYGRMTRRLDQAHGDQNGASVRLQDQLYYDGLNNLVFERQSDAVSGGAVRTTAYTYGAGGMLASMTDATGVTRSYHYSIRGELLRDEVTTKRSNQATDVTFYTYKSYDAAGRTISEQVASYDAVQGSRTGLLATTTYNAYGEVTARGIGPNSSSISVVEQMDYDSAGRVVRSNSGDGIWKFFVYDKAGNATLTMTSTGAASLAGWGQADALNNAAAAGTTALAGFNQTYVNASIVVYDRRGMAAQTWEPNRTIAGADVATTQVQTLNTQRWYNAFGEVAQEKTARGNYTNYAYNTMGRLVQIQAPEITVTSESGATARQRPTENYAYDISGRMVALQNANGFWTSRVLLAGSGYGKDEALVVTEYRPDSSVWSTGYDVYSLARRVTDGIGRVTLQDFDNAGRMVKVTKASGLVEEYAFDALGRRTRHWNSATGTPVYTETLVGYDSYGVPIYTYTVTGYTPVYETTDYDAQGRVTSQVNFAGDATTYSYSWSGISWTRATSFANGHASSDTTDVYGRMSSRTDLGGRVYTYSYNWAGQLVQQTSTAGQNLTYTWYNTGRLATMVDNAITYTGYSNANIDAAYTYDADGNRTYEKLQGTSYYYDPYTGYAYSSATFTLQEGRGAYDEMGHLTSFTDAGAAGNGAVSITNQYDAAGNVRRTLTTHATINNDQTIGAAVTDDYWYKYDALNRMTLVKGSLVGGAIVRANGDARSITYDAAGQRASQSRTVLSYQLYVGATAAEEREVYTYNADGLVSQVQVGTGAATTYTTTVPSGLAAPTVFTNRAATTYNLLGQVTDYREFAADGATVQFNRYGINYDLRGNVTSEASTLRRTESDGYLYVNYSSVSNSYAAGGVLSSSYTSNYRYKNGTTYQDTPDTSNTYTYQWWDSAMQSDIAYKPDVTKATTYGSTFYYDVNGHLTSVYVNDGRPRSVTYTNDANGQIMVRREQDNTTNGDPKQVWWYFDGKQVGTVTNNGNDDPDYGTALNERVQTAPATAGPFRLGATVGSAYADFDQAYNSLSPGEGSSAGTAYTARSGDTLQGLAQQFYGDASLWYKIADANGLSGASSITAGQSLRIPAGLANIHNTSDTFRPYDSAQHIGDVQPTTPAPPKKPKCGVFGQILLAVISAAIVAIAPFGAGFWGTIANAVLGSVVSQAVGVATGIQEKFSFKAVAMAAVGAAVGGGLSALGDKAGTFGAFINGGEWYQVAAKAALSSAITQGVGVATGLQDKFDWAGVAAAGVAAGVGVIAGKAIGA